MTVGNAVTDSPVWPLVQSWMKSSPGWTTTARKFLFIFIQLHHVVWSTREQQTEFEAARLKDLASLSIVQFQNGFHRMNIEFVSF